MQPLTTSIPRRRTPHAAAPPAAPRWRRGTGRHSQKARVKKPTEPLYQSKQSRRMSRPMRAWRPCTAKSLAVTGRVPSTYGVWSGAAGGMSRPTSYWSAACGVAPVVGVISKADPVGDSPRLFRIAVSIQVLHRAPCQSGGHGASSAIAHLPRSYLIPCSPLSSFPCVHANASRSSTAGGASMAASSASAAVRARRAVRTPGAAAEQCPVAVAKPCGRLVTRASVRWPLAPLPALRNLLTA